MELTEFLPGLPDIVLREVATLPSSLPGGEPAGQYSEARPGELLIVIPALGSFLIRGGRSVDFSIDPAADRGIFTQVMNGSARAALIHQRGEYPLHAASLVPPGGVGAIAICGASGNGKSTLAAALSQRGWALVADDTTRISTVTGRPLAWPSSGQIKLWGDACTLIGVVPATLRRVSALMDKYYLPAPAHAEPVRLSAIFELQPGTAPGCRPVEGADRMGLLLRHACRPQFVKPMGGQRAQFDLVRRMAADCRLFGLGGAKALSVEELADSVAATVAILARERPA